MTVTQISQSIADNTSTVSWSLVLKRPSKIISSVNKAYSVVIDGVTVASGSTLIGGSGNKTIASGTRTIQHGSDGTKTLSFSFSMVVSITWSGVPTGNASGSGSMTLTPIPRYAQITSFTLGSATRDSFKVNWAADKNVNRVEYKIGSGSWVAGSTSTAKSGSFTVSGRSAGTTYSVAIRVRAADSNLWTESSAKSISTVAAAKGNTPTLSSRTCIQAVMNWTSTQTCINVQYRIGSGSWQSTGSNFSARSSGSFTITGLSPNTSYSISIRVLDAVHSSWSGASGSTNITTYRLTTAGAPTFNTGSSFTVGLSRAHPSITHDITLQFWHDNQSWVDVATVTGATTDVTFSLNANQLNTIYNGRVTSKTATTRLKIVNKWGSTTQGTSYSSNGTVTIVNAAPTIDGVSYLDTNSAVQALLGNDQKILRNKSTLRVIAGQATSQKGAYLSSYRVTIGGNEYSVSANGGTSESGKIINVGTVNQSANQTAVLTVVDSRGYTATRSFTVQMLDYVAPQFIHASADRLNNYEQSTTMNINARRTIVKPASTDINVVEMRYRIKQNPSGSYGSYINLVAENGSVSGVYQNVNVSQHMGDYPNDQSYTVEVGIRDKFTDWNTILITLTEGIALLRYMQDKIEMGVPLDVAGKINAAGGIHFADTRSVTELPEDLPSKALSLVFKYRTSVGNPPVSASSTYAHIIRVAGWSSHEGSGGWPTEVSVGGDGIAVRQATSATTWGSWKKLSVDGHSHSWSSITSKPSTFAPSSHNHSGADITSGTVPYARLPVGTGSSQVAQGSHSHAWSAITSKPSTFPPSSHTHSYLPLSGGTLTGNLYLSGGTRYIGTSSANTLGITTSGTTRLSIDTSGHITYTPTNARNITVSLDARMSGSGGTEPTFHPSSDKYGFLGADDRCWFRTYSTQYYQSSSIKHKTNLKEYDKKSAYEKLKSLVIYDYDIDREKENSNEDIDIQINKSMMNNETDNNLLTRQMGVVSETAPREIKGTEYKPITEAQRVIKSVKNIDNTEETELGEDVVVDVEETEVEVEEDVVVGIEEVESDSIDLYSFISFVASALQEAQNKIEYLEAKVQSLATK